MFSSQGVRLIGIDKGGRRDTIYRPGENPGDSGEICLFGAGGLE